jgi:asparagine synthase (glutamine-hydrolysing)
MNRILYLDMKLYMESDILVKVDRASMANSLEVRVPLLNKVMMDYVNTLPFDLKLKGFTRKYIFRQAMRGKLPDEIIDRPKKGFGMPIAKWLRGELKGLMMEMLSDNRLRESGVFEPAYVARLVDDHLAMRSDNRKQLWSLLVFQMWYERYARS